jgi:hypothetical protein
MIDDHRGVRRERAAEPAMRQERRRGLHPQQAVELFGRLGVGREHANGAVLRIGLVHESGGDGHDVVDVRIEIDRRHAVEHAGQARLAGAPPPRSGERAGEAVAFVAGRRPPCCAKRRAGDDRLIRRCESRVAQVGIAIAS